MRVFWAPGNVFSYLLFSFYFWPNFFHSSAVTMIRLLCYFDPCWWWCYYYRSIKLICVDDDAVTLVRLCCTCWWWCCYYCLIVLICVDDDAVTIVRFFLSVLMMMLLQSFDSFDPCWWWCCYYRFIALIRVDDDAVTIDWLFWSVLRLLCCCYYCKIAAIIN